MPATIAVLMARLVALLGKSGAGKTTVAQHLVEHHGFVHCKTGAECRRIAAALFADDSKSMLNRITHAMREIQPDVWAASALRMCDLQGDLVFDSARFPEDIALLRGYGFRFWRIVAPTDLRTERLSERGQPFDVALDDDDYAETALDDVQVDVAIENAGPAAALAQQIEDAVRPFA